jgi:RTX calcium-binding nonapeptide repeat (4 copies)
VRAVGPARRPGLALVAVVGMLVLVSTAVAASIVGTPGADVLRGTPKADVIFGKGGDDVIYGLSGNDRIVPGPGRDRVFCGPGVDRVVADRLDRIAKDCEQVSRPAPLQPPTPPAPAIGTRANPVPLGQLASITAGLQAGWRLRINRSTPDATDLVLETFRGNRPPDPGDQYFLVSISVRYDGPGSARPSAVLKVLGAMGDADSAYWLGPPHECGVLPEPQLTMLAYEPVATGTEVTGNVCFAVQRRDAASLLVYTKVDEGSLPVWFALRSTT